jgi:hypothetical protein
MVDHFIHIKLNISDFVEAFNSVSKTSSFWCMILLNRLSCYLIACEGLIDVTCLTGSKMQ